MKKSIFQKGKCNAVSFCTTGLVCVFFNLFMMNGDKKVFPAYRGKIPHNAGQNRHFAGQNGAFAGQFKGLAGQFFIVIFI